MDKLVLSIRLDEFNTESLREIVEQAAADIGVSFEEALYTVMSEEIVRNEASVTLVIAASDKGDDEQLIALNGRVIGYQLEE